MKDVIVTGGRDYSDQARLEKVLSLFDIGLLIDGGAMGADYLARMYAKKHGIENVTIKADWELRGKGAGPKRNSEMLDKYPNAIVIAFPGGPGTENCVRQAMDRGRIVLRFEHNEDHA